MTYFCWLIRKVKNFYSKPSAEIWNQKYLNCLKLTSNQWFSKASLHKTCIICFAPRLPLQLSPRLYISKTNSHFKEKKKKRESRFVSIENMSLKTIHLYISCFLKVNNKKWKSFFLGSENKSLYRAKFPFRKSSRDNWQKYVSEYDVKHSNNEKPQSKSQEKGKMFYYS